MAEEEDFSDAGHSGNDPSADPAALALALNAAQDDRVAAEAAAYLKTQRHLVTLQYKYIADKEHFEVSHLRWRRFTEQMKGTLQLMTAVMGLAAAIALGLMVWAAAHSDGLKVEPFSVPPVLAEHGLTGQVVAARVIDRLSELQAQTNTSRPARSYTNAWGDNPIKLEIPETGISLSELDSWLREKIGHETPLTGEVVRTATGVTLTARTGGDGAVSVSGAEADMDALTGKLAEAIYRLTQPYRYAIYLLRHENRAAEAAPIFRELALHGGPRERQWSYNMWASATEISSRDFDLGLRMFQQAHAADPDATQPMPTLASDLVRFGRLEEALQISKERMTMASSRVGSIPVQAQAGIDAAVGNYVDALQTRMQGVQVGRPGFSRYILLNALIQTQIGMHDAQAARANLAQIPMDVDTDPLFVGVAGLAIDAGTEDWRKVNAQAMRLKAELDAARYNRHAVLANLTPLLALAQARLGDIAAAEKTIAPTPADCYPCLITRAQIAELAGRHAHADWWFDRATQAGPSFPFAEEAQGRALLDRGQPDQAIARFTIANRKGQHFADPLEGWGEALMAKNQSHLAVAKFAEAEKYAPNWGRLHLKWGEALWYAGKKDDAKAQFARAATLDLTPSGKSELASHAVAKNP